VEHAGGAFLVDCSTDFRVQALRHRIERVDALLLTHGHADHVNGIDDLRIINMMQHAAIPVYGDTNTLHAIRQRYDYSFNPLQKGGGLPVLELCEVADGDRVDIGGIEAVCVPIRHGLLPAMGYRLGPDFAYLTDCNDVPESSIRLIEGVDTLVVDGLRFRPHPTHFSIPEAVALARRVGARRTAFTHITHDIEHFRVNALLPPGMFLLQDNMVLDARDR
jgi:phosphoribosyl 1,2-cyclic phosphate phosphodiesterase